VEGEGFKAAGELEEGEYVQTADGEILQVFKVQKEYLEEPVTVYNFEVEDWHTYYVSEEEVLVHNTCMMPKGDSSSKHMLGANGTQVASKTTWKNGKTERIDVENPAPGERPGQIHYHDTNNSKYYYDIEINMFYNQKTGELAAKSIQKLLKDNNFMKGIMVLCQDLAQVKMRYSSN